MSSFLICPMRVIFAKRFLSAFMMMLCPCVLKDLFILISLKVFSLGFFSRSKKPLVALVPSLSSQKSLNATVSLSLAPKRSLAMLSGATDPVERLMSSEGSPNGLVQLLSSILTKAETSLSSFLIRRAVRSGWLNDLSLPSALLSKPENELLYSAVR